MLRGRASRNLVEPCILGASGLLRSLVCPLARWCLIGGLRAGLRHILVSGKRVYRGLMRLLSRYNHDCPEDVHGQQGEEKTNKEFPREWLRGTHCWITASRPFFC
jgi:hypothetical protein